MLDIHLNIFQMLKKLDNTRLPSMVFLKNDNFNNKNDNLQEKNL